LFGGILLGAVVLTICRRKGIALFKVEDGALSPHRLQAALLLFATLVGGTWVVYTVAVTGTIDLQQLTRERERRNQDPRINIELQVETLATDPSNSQPLIPVHIQATVENKGVKEVRLVFLADKSDRQPASLLLIGKVDPDKPGAIAKETIDALPYISLSCKPQGDCASRRWVSGALEAGGFGYYTFLHPGLPPGLYYVQFQLEVPHEAITPTGQFQQELPVVWTRAKYFQVLDPKVAAAVKAISAPAKN
jgi:hypothetical protein